MSIPSVTENALGYKFDWSDEQITILVNRLKQHNDGRLNGEIVITTAAPGYEPHLHQAAFNFTSSGARGKLAKDMKTRLDLDWDSILEQLSVLTLRRFRAGTPVETIWPATEEIKPPAYLVDPLVIQHYPSIIFGDPSSGKSTLAQMMICLLTLPWWDNPLGLTVTNKSHECIVFDYETDRDTVSWQLACIIRGMGLPEFGFHYRRCFLPLADDIDEALKAIESTNAKVIIIDSLGPACGGELNEAKPALALFGALRRLNRTAFILAHNSKSTEGKGKSIYGSIFFLALARSVWEIKKVQSADADEIEVGLFHRKPPPFAKLHKPLGFKFSFDGDKTVINVQDPKTVDEFLQQMGTQQRIYELLKSGAMSPKEISENLEISSGDVRTTLFRMKSKNKVIKIGENYGLVNEL